MIPARSDNEVMDTKLLYEAYTDASNRPRVPSEELETTAVRERPRAPPQHTEQHRHV